MTDLVTITGPALRTWRRALNLTQHGLARELGVSYGAVAHWEQGRHDISPRTVRQILDLAARWKVDPPNPETAFR